MTFFHPSTCRTTTQPLSSTVFHLFTFCNNMQFWSKMIRNWKDLITQISGTSQASTDEDGGRQTIWLRLTDWDDEVGRTINNIQMWTAGEMDKVGPSRPGANSSPESYNLSLTWNCPYSKMLNFLYLMVAQWRFGRVWKFNSVKLFDSNNDFSISF